MTDSIVDISGGSIETLRAEAGSVASIRGGYFGSGTRLESDSEVTITGGNFGTSFAAVAGSEVTIAGGVFGRNVNFSPNAVELIGGEFVLNGAAYTDSTISLNEGDTFTGVLQDGSAFIFSKTLLDSLEDVTLTTTSIPAPTINDFVVDSADPVGVFSSLRNGQTIRVLEGGSLPNTFENVGGAIEVAGGSLGRVASLGGSIELSGGTIEEARFISGGSLEVSDGQFGLVEIRSGQIDITGGIQGSERELLTSRVDDGSTVNISGGRMLGSFEINDSVP